MEPDDFLRKPRDESDKDEISRQWGQLVLRAVVRTCSSESDTEDRAVELIPNFVAQLIREEFNRHEYKILHRVCDEIRGPLAVGWTLLNKVTAGSDLTEYELSDVSRRAESCMRCVAHQLNDTLYIQPRMLEWTPCRDAVDLADDEILEPALCAIELLQGQGGIPPNCINVEVVGPDATAFVDVQAIRQVLFNIVAHAIRRCTERPSEVRIDVVISIDESYVTIELKHNGSKMSSALAEALEKSDIMGERERLIARDGLSLIVVRRIANAHEGGIKVSGCRRKLIVSLRSSGKPRVPERWVL